MEDYKRFADDFDLIDRVKSDDKFLVQDSSDGIVKKATPAQIDARFAKLEADIDTAVAAAASASQSAQDAQDTADSVAASLSSAVETATSEANAAKTAAQSAQSAAEAAKTAAQTAKSQAETFADDAQDAADDAHSATDIAAEGVADIEARLESLEKKFADLISGTLIVEKLTLRALELYGPTSLVKSGNGAPAAAPDFVPQFYCNLLTGDYYKAKGSSAVSDWIIL